MQTTLADFIKHTPEGQEAAEILGKCVHCGFCTATCPTYQLLGDELDSPRGRIYLIKQVLEGVRPTEKTQLHLDRCLTCRNCETTCPSGVQYGRLVDIGRKVVEEQVPRPFGARMVRSALKAGLTSPLFGPAMKLGQLARPLLPGSLKSKVPAAQQAGITPGRPHKRKMLLLAGCVQPAMLPNINAATLRVFDALGIELVIPPAAGCCGAIRYHLNDHAGGLNDARANIDAWWPHVDAGCEAIVMNASGCGAQVREYGHMLRDDVAYSVRAQRISELTRDIAEVLPAMADAIREKLRPLGNGRVVFHSPCTLQHGQQVRGEVEALLDRARRRGAAGGRVALLLRLGGNVLGAAARSRLPAARPPPRPPAGAGAGRDPVGQRRLHHAPAERHRAAGPALDRVARRASFPGDNAVAS